LRRTRVLAAVLALAACSSAPSFEGLGPAHDGGGPKVQFDLSTPTFPGIPFPNDILTRPDASTHTGLRLNTSLIALSSLQANLRGTLDMLDGFGTFAPISVAFDQDLDALDLFACQNDPARANCVYLIDLTTGASVPLDFGGGRLPLTLISANSYFPGDPDAAAFNLLFPVSGPLANFLHPSAPHDTQRQQADDLMTFYERSTRTLIIRPVLPLAQERRYAVVLTDRIRGTGGAPISSPHSGINHASQTGQLQPLLSRLPPGTALSDIAYTWAFTTQSITRDLEQIRQGMQGQGTLTLLSFEYPVQAGISSTVYTSAFNVLQETGPFTPGGTPFLANYRLTPEQLKPALEDPVLQGILAGSDPAALQALEDTYKYVDYFVSGTFVGPGFLEGGPGAPQDQFFQFDAHTATALTFPQRITFLLAVPKQQPEVGHLAPFPTVIAGHEYEGSRTQPVLAVAGTFAKFGLATIAIDAYGHGLGLDPAAEKAARDAFSSHGLESFADALFTGRARDLDNDGIADPGGDFWTGDAFHTRDTIRQSIVDWMQLIRLLRTFDGTGSMAVGNNVVRAGDFNNDGVPDVGGPPQFPFTVLSSDGRKHLFEKGDRDPGSDLFVFGQSLGGTLAGLLPAVEPAIVATAPASPAAGLTDVELRTTVPGIQRGVFLELFGPLFVTCHFDPAAGPVDAQTGTRLGACTPGTADTLVLVVQNVNRERDIPIAPLTLAPGQQVMVQNLAHTTADCSTGAPADGCSVGAADAQGLLRLPIAADWPSLLATATSRPLPLPPEVTVQVIGLGDPLRIVVLPLAPGAPQRQIATYGFDTRFNGVAYKAGDPLTSPARGFALQRNTSQLRQMITIAQTILDPADPVNYAQYWSDSPLAVRTTAENGRVAGPATGLVIGTAGDPAMPVAGAISLARAAGVVGLSQPDSAYGMTIEQVLIQSGAVEGIATTQRFDAASGGVLAALGNHVVCDPGADCAGDVLIDVTGYSCSAGACSDGLQTARLDPPLRQQLVRATVGAGPCPVNKLAGTAGCYSTGASACNPAAPGVTALMLPYLSRTGQHGFAGPQPAKAFDVDQFIANAIGRYFECRGRELHFDECQQDLARCPWIPQPPP